MEQLHRTWTTFEPSMTADLYCPLASVHYFWPDNYYFILRTTYYKACCLERGLVQYSQQTWWKSHWSQWRTSHWLSWTLVKAMKMILCCYFRLTSMLLHPLLNCVLFIHPATSTIKLRLSNNSRCPWNTKSTMAFDRNLHEILNHFK